MAAQIGSSVLLSYGNQGTQQSGASVTLDYSLGDFSGGGSKTLKSSIVSAWVKASHKINDLFSPQPATVREDQSRKGGWVPSAVQNVSGHSGWVATDHKDTNSAAPWLQFGEMLNEDKGGNWKKSAATDDLSAAPWLQFGEMLNEDKGGNWKGSEPIDAFKTGEWIRPRARVLLPVSYVRPVGTAAHFSAIGGGIVAIFGAGAYTPPLGSAITAIFGNQPYTAPFYRLSREGHPIVSGSAANFRYDPVLTPAFDEFGNPIFELAQRDVYRKVPWGLSKRADNDTTHPWRVYSRPLNPGWGIPTEGGSVEPQPGETLIIPVQRVYIVINEIQLLRVDGLTPITAMNMSVSFDCDSWLPQFSATIPESARDAIMPSPNMVEVAAYINGAQFNFFVERIQRNRQFGQNTISIGGRGIACELDAPYAVASHHTHTIDKTAQQLIDAALQYTAYTQTWNITDWLIPGNTFSHFGTPASVAAQVAEASGSVLQADRELRKLRMLPRYPVKPWDWGAATPEYIIPADIAQTESIEWIEKPTYNVAYVSGTQNGVLGRVKITGTAGDKPAPMVTHPLITHNDAARQRGIAILGDTGRKAMMRITMPVLESSGIIDVCRFIEFNDGTTARRGIIRANNVSVNWPTVRQTLTVEAAV